jgi:tetratricopeptide (TPR) repeat protein
VDAAQLRQLTLQALEVGDLELALTRLREAVRSNTNDSALLQELAGSLWALYDFDGALAAYHLAAEAEPGAVGPCLLAAQKLFSIGRFRECAEWLETALAASPNDVVILTMAGEVYDRCGRLVDAERMAQEALASAPRYVKAVRLMAHLERRRGQFDQARQRLADHLARFPGPDDWRLRYELAAVLDRLGDYDRAMRELVAAKSQLAPRARPHVAEAGAARARQQEIAALLTRADFAVWQAAQRRLAPAVRLAFLCGHPRSGTTLLERMLDAHPDVVSTDETGILAREFVDPIIRRAASPRAGVQELQSFTAEQLAAGRATYLRFTQMHVGTPVGGRLLLEKDPGLTPDLPLPLRLFPEARVVFPLRDPRDVCVSYFFNLIPLNRVSVAARDLRSTCESCAHSLRLWHRWREVLPYPWIETRYEDLVARPEPELRRLLEFLGVPWSDRPLRFHERPQHEKGVRTPTYADVAQPLYQRAVGRWKNYERHLAPHREILDPWLRVFGYA